MYSSICSKVAMPMNERTVFDWARFWTILRKEFIQMRRDRLTFAMIIAIPLIQLLIFGYAINSDPKHLPTQIIDLDSSRLSRTLVAAMQNTGYFDIRSDLGMLDADTALRAGAIQFALTIPPGFSREVLAGRNPAVLFRADATDPAATGNALAALTVLNRDLFARELPRSQENDTQFTIIVHRQYNPEGLSRYNIVPGLIGVILTMTMVVITAMAITRERERGTMESLLATPVRPLELFVGKIVPFVFVGYAQVVVILVAGKLLFAIPLYGSLLLLSVSVLLFVAANLAVGYTFSTLASTQHQASQMAMFFFLPSMLLSGFMFPFRGMPVWAQALGELLPLTHFLRIVRGIMLKGSGLQDVFGDIWPIALFLLAAASIAIFRFRETID